MDEGSFSFSWPADINRHDRALAQHLPTAAR
jgi:hypothetical protein